MASRYLKFAAAKLCGDKEYARLDMFTLSLPHMDKDIGVAADIYLRVTKAKIVRAERLKIIDQPEFQFTITPKNTYPLTEFLHRVSAIKNKPASWRDYFFQDATPLQGS
ncbi:ABC transporter, periplasmic substrate-binding protein [Pseudomonas cannabina]|uniref:ABC transporter, periplasmic substrate-binding protein n=1 Tax=Pseudomonas cannabina TaxID=86840 RepID=A0A0P9N526_PSECA|nr:putative ABC transporter, periplasmic substrate-binding protein [Pseudomonas cannabina]RMN19362.1 ABC transporter, periplasmic substrate-binding protein [Pseudomonas cannabina]